MRYRLVTEYWATGEKVHSVQRKGLWGWRDTCDTDAIRWMADRLIAATQPPIDCKDKGLVLSFDEASPLVFVQKDLVKCEVCQNGERAKGIMSIQINAESMEITTHEIKYVTGRTDSKALGSTERYTVIR